MTAMEALKDIARSQNASGEQGLLPHLMDVGITMWLAHDLTSDTSLFVQASLKYFHEMGHWGSWAQLRDHCGYVRPLGKWGNEHQD